MDSSAIGARMDRLPASPAIWKLIALLSLGGFFEYYDLFFTGYIAPGLVRTGILTASTRGIFGTTGIASFVAAMFSGLFLGTLLFGFVADRFGRKTIFTYSLLWYTAASIMMALQNDVWGLNLWRFISGIGVGVELVTIDAYLAELTPKEMRGRAFALNQTIQFTAVPAVALLAWMLVPKAPFGVDGWRWVVVLGSVGAVFVWWIRRSVPESPRWLAQRGRFMEADLIVREWEGSFAHAPALRWPPPKRPDTLPKQGSFAEIWGNPVYRRRTLMLVIFNIFQAVGFYGFSNWVPTLLIARGIPVTSSLQYTFLIALAAPLGPSFGLVLADKFERKWQIVCAAAGVAVFGLLFGQVTAAAGLIVLGMLLTVSNNVLSFSFHAFQAELYPTRIRALAVGFAYSWSRLSVVFSAFAIGFVLDHVGAGGVFAFISASMLIVMLAIGLLGPRTNQLALEAISR